MERLIVGVLATVAVTATLTAAPAQADQRSFTDRSGDVGHAMDIHRVTMRNDHRLVVTLRHRAVSERGGGWSGIYIDVTPARNASPDYYLAGSLGGDYQLFWMDGWRRIGGKLGCPGGDYKQSYSSRADTTTFALSRSCLNGATFRATRVRVAAIAGATSGPTDWAPGYHRYSPWVALN